LKTRKHHHRRSRWTHCNTPEALMRRKAKADARREAIAAELPPVDPGPAPLSPWQTVQVLDAHGEVMHSLPLFVPARGHRCDQHAAADGRLLTATDVGRMVAGWIAKRPSVAVLAEQRRFA
jgi:hypothetical protein